MKKNLLLGVVLVSLILTGCGRKYMMTRPDMHLAPSLEQLPEKFTVVNYAVNPVLDISEGGDGRFAWPAVMWDKTGQETKLLALNLGNFGVDKQFLIVIPKSLAEVIGGRLAVFDHGGKRMYNHMGEERKIESISRKVDLRKYPDFLSELEHSSDFVKELDISSEDFRAILKLYNDFRIREIKTVRNYIYQTYGSNLTSERLDQIAKDDAIVRGFVDWLGRDWKIYVTWPFVDIGSTALAAGLVKVFTLPSIWGDRLDRPGYMEHRPDAEETAKMILRGIKEYGAKRAVVSRAADQQPLPDAIKAAIKGTPCENAETYAAYNQCAVEYNKKITEE